MLDEADRMLDMGFIHDIRTIVAKLPKERQTLLFSATMPREIADLAAHMLRDPARVAVTPVASTVERIAQRVIMIDKPAKSALLIEVLRGEVHRPDAGVHPHQARRRQGGEAACTMPACPPRRSTATSRRTSASACSARSAPASSRRWSRPTSRRAASTSTASATSSITTCRTFRRATCTASAAPRAPARTASRSRSATTRRWRSCATSRS